MQLILAYLYRFFRGLARETLATVHVRKLWPRCT